MCGRFTQSKLIIEYMDELSPGWRGTVTETRAPTWNLAPTALSWAVRQIEGEPSPSLLKWGYGHDPETKGVAPINARVETAETKYLFRDAWKNRPCIVPADGWYEWKEEAAGKQPYYFTRLDAKPLFFAGLWTTNSFCLFTTASDGSLTTIHDRKPVSLEPTDALAWIKEPWPTENLIHAAVKAEAFGFHRVSKAVSNWRNDGARLLERAGPTTQQPAS